MKSVARKRVVLASVKRVSRFICLRLRGSLYAALQACAISQPMLTIWATFTISSSGIVTSTICRAQPHRGLSSISDVWTVFHLWCACPRHIVRLHP